MSEFGDILNAYCMASIGEHAVFEDIVQDVRDRAVVSLSNKPNSGAWYAEQLTRGTTNQTLASTLAKLPPPVGSDIEGRRENQPKTVTFKDSTTGGLSDTSTAAIIKNFNKNLGTKVDVGSLQQQYPDLGRHKSLTEYTVHESPQGKSVPRMGPGKTNPQSLKTSKLLSLTPEKLTEHTKVEPPGTQNLFGFNKNYASFTAGGDGFQSSFPRSNFIPGTQIRTPSAANGAADRTQSLGSGPGSHAGTGNTQPFQGQPVPRSAQNLSQTLPLPTIGIVPNLSLIVDDLLRAHMKKIWKDTDQLGVKIVEMEGHVSQLDKLQ